MPELDAQIQVVDAATTTLAEHLEADPPPLPPTDSAVATDAIAAAAAESTATSSTSYLLGLLDQQGLLGDPNNIELGDALDMRDAAVANRGSAIAIAARIKEQALRRQQPVIVHNPADPPRSSLQPSIRETSELLPAKTS